MEVNNSFGRIKKFNEKSCTISLREFKARYHFSNVVCELELKYGANYTKAFTFKQLAHYVHYEALNLHILKWIPTLRVGVPNLQRAIVGVIIH